MVRRSGRVAKAAFLTAEWRHLVMLNFPTDPGALKRYVPAGTEVDDWNGATFVSLVGFRFLRTRVKGVAVPMHRSFDEINLRFYVRHRASDGWRRGVVFVREVVPRRAIALVARWLYNENYVACSIRSRVDEPANGTPGVARYSFRHKGDWLTLGCEYSGEPAYPGEGSEEEFITEHYWGYSAQRDGSSLVYRVEHPQWRVWSASRHVLEGDFVDFYGSEFREALASPPNSAFVADGSPVVVRQGTRLHGQEGV